MKIKKLLFFLLFLFSSLLVVSQNNQQITDQQNFIGKIFPPNFSIASPIPPTTPCSRWYNYGQSIKDYLQGTSAYRYNYLFPDSTILVNYSGTYLGPWIHKIVDIFDPNAEIFNNFSMYPNALFITNNSYILDSINVYGFYKRKLTSVTDTLLIQISVKPNSSTYSYYSSTSPIAINLATDTLKFRPINYNQANNKFGEVITWQIKIPLTANTAIDTLEYGINVLKVSPKLIIPANSFIITNVEFIPGYTWIANHDTITSKNNFQFLSFDENPGQFPMYTKGDYNSSYILPFEVRYNQAGSWNGNYKPSFAYMASSPNYYSYTHHLIYYKASIGPLATISGSNSVDTGEVQVYSVPSQTNTTYSWSVSNGTIISGNGSNQISVKWGNANVYAWVKSNVSSISCSSSDSMKIAIGSVGIENINIEKSFKIYPNPATDYLNIEGQNLNFTFEIINILGEKIQGGILTNRIDISGFANGIYILNIYDKNNRIVKREKVFKQ